MHVGEEVAFNFDKCVILSVIATYKKWLAIIPVQAKYFLHSSWLATQLS